MSESTTPSDKGVPDPPPPGGSGNRAKLACHNCGIVAPLWVKFDDHPLANASFMLCRACYEERYGVIVDI